MGGHSLGSSINGVWGTLGVFATEIGSQKLVALTAQHVIGSTAIGTEFYAPWPGAPDFKLLGHYLRGLQNGTDAAAIQVADAGTIVNTITELGAVRGWRPIVQSDIGKAVWMFGAKSGSRTGVIQAVHVDLPRHNLVDTFMVRIDAAEGDSGSAIVDDKNLVLGLLVGQSSSTGWHVFTPIDLVLFHLKCSI